MVYELAELVLSFLVGEGGSRTGTLRTGALVWTAREVDRAVFLVGEAGMPLVEEEATAAAAFRCAACEGRFTEPRVFVLCDCRATLMWLGRLKDWASCVLRIDVSMEARWLLVHCKQEAHL